MREEGKELEKKGKNNERFGKPIGIFELEVIDKKTGKVLETRKVKNLVVNGGKTIIRNGFYSRKYWNEILSEIGIGKNGTAPTVEDTDLIEPYRKQSCSQEWDDVNKRRVAEALFTDFTETVNICEAGVYTSNDILFNRVTFASVEVSPTKNLRVKVYIIP